MCHQLPRRPPQPTLVKPVDWRSRGSGRGGRRGMKKHRRWRGGARGGTTSQRTRRGGGGDGSFTTPGMYRSTICCGPALQLDRPSSSDSTTPHRSLCNTAGGGSSREGMTRKRRSGRKRCTSPQRRFGKKQKVSLSSHGTMHGACTTASDSRRCRASIHCRLWLLFFFFFDLLSVSILPSMRKRK